jgi:hypothetical protein
MPSTVASAAVDGCDLFVFHLYDLVLGMSIKSRFIIKVRDRAFGHILDRAHD